MCDLSYEVSDGFTWFSGRNANCDLKTVGPASHAAVWESDVRKFPSLAEIGRLIYSSRDLPAALNRIVVSPTVCQRSSWGSCGITGSRQAPVRTRL